MHIVVRLVRGAIHGREVSVSPGWTIFLFLGHSYVQLWIVILTGLLEAQIMHLLE